MANFAKNDTGNEVISMKFLEFETFVSSIVCNKRPFEENAHQGRRFPWVTI